MLFPSPRGVTLFRHTGTATLACATLFATLALAAGQARAAEPAKILNVQDVVKTVEPARAVEQAPGRTDLIVKYDQSQLLRLPRPAAEIIIGNATIADVTVQSGNLLVLTGKTFGITNMIVLDAERNVILDQRVTVQRDENKVVHLMRGAQRLTFNCTPQCNPSSVIGDDMSYFAQTLAASNQKTTASEKASDAGQQNNNQ